MPPGASIPQHQGPPPNGAFAPNGGQPFAPNGAQPFAPPVPQLREQEIALNPQRARVTVKLPSDARLWVENVLCPLTSGERTFNTPTLQPGRQYFYTLKVEVNRNGRALSENRRVYLSGGQQITVDFTTVNTASARR